MDDPVTSAQAGEKAPVVVMAGHFQFGPGEQLTNRHVASRALIWGYAGAGTLEVAGRTIALPPGGWAFLPWLHDITYRADPHDPFMVGGIHVIPWHDPGVPVETHAAHGRRDRLAGVPYRKDVDWPELRGVVEGRSIGRSRLLMLAALAVDHLHDGRPDELTLRALATLLLNEIRAAAVSELARERVPLALARMQEFIVVHLNRPLTVAEIAGSAGVSASTAERLFRRHAGCPVAVWVAEKRMDVARELLRTTTRPVGVVAREVGFNDQSYFSRAFRRMNGISPRSYAERSRLL